jgi:hypothetical protein
VSGVLVVFSQTVPHGQVDDVDLLFRRQKLQSSSIDNCITKTVKIYIHTSSPGV